MAGDVVATSKGVSLAKGPVGILGLIGIFYGVSGLLFASHGFALHIPHGAVHGTKWIGLKVNGWTELLFIAAGLALALFAPLHAGAKGMATLVGLVLIAAAVIAVIRKDGVFGIFAANHLTELVWAAAGALLLALALLPRVGGGGEATVAARPQPRPRRTPSSNDERSDPDRPLVEPRGHEEAVGQPQRERWVEGADEQDRPPDIGARRRDHPSRQGERNDGDD